MAKTKKIKEVAVILGDPDKYDMVKPSNAFDQDDQETVYKLKEALNELKDYRFIYLNNHDKLGDNLNELRNEIDFALNFCDEGFNNDPEQESFIPYLLERSNIPYTGAGPSCMETCYDKMAVKKCAGQLNIPVAKSFTLEEKINFPVIIKPAKADGSFGITKDSVANTEKELNKAIKNLREKFSYKDEILIEEFLPGDEITTGIIGNPPEHEILPAIKEDYSKLPQGLPKICGYEAKWNPDSAYWKALCSIPANLFGEAKEIVEQGSLELFQELGCRDYARFDWRFDGNGKIKLIEANPNPGWCWDGHLAKMCCIKGISYPEMLGKILNVAERRIYLNKPL